MVSSLHNTFCRRMRPNRVHWKKLYNYLSRSNRCLHPGALHESQGGRLLFRVLSTCGTLMIDDFLDAKVWCVLFSRCYLSARLAFVCIVKAITLYGKGVPLSAYSFITYLFTIPFCNITVADVVGHISTWVWDYCSAFPLPSCAFQAYIFFTFADDRILLRVNIIVSLCQMCTAIVFLFGFMTLCVKSHWYHTLQLPLHPFLSL